MCGKGGGGAGGGRKEGREEGRIGHSLVLLVVLDGLPRCDPSPSTFPLRCLVPVLMAVGLIPDHTSWITHMLLLYCCSVAALLLLIATQLCPSSGVPNLAEGA